MSFVRNERNFPDPTMSLIKNAFIYLLLLVFDVRTIINEVEMLESCVNKIDMTIASTNEENSNLLKLIDQSSVILKAFGSENLINVVDDDGDDNESVNMDPFAENFDENRIDGKSLSSGDVGNYDIGEDSFYSDYYVYKSGDDKKLKTLMTFAPITVYKGVHILRQLELFNNQEYYQIKGWVCD